VAHLMPMVQFEGEAYVLVTPQLAGIARSELGPPAGSLAERRDTVVAAMDFLRSGF
jgi:toxin CcdB